MRQIIAIVFLVSLASGPAAAQVATSLDRDETYIPVIQFGIGGTVCFPDGFCIAEQRGIPLGAFATTTQLDALSDRIDSLLPTLTTFANQLSAFDARLTNLSNQIGAINNTLVSIDGRLTSIDEDVSKALEVGAISAALKDAVPIDDDRFALRVNAAGFSGEFAGAVGFSYNVAERARVLFNYGRGRSENVFAGGVNISFR